MKTSQTPHAVLLSPPNDPLAAFVRLYAHRFRVELGPQATLPKPVAVLCNADGTEMRRVDLGQDSPLIADFEGIAFEQRWRGIRETSG